MLRLLDQVDDQRPESFAHRMRGRRFERFERACSPLPRPLRILDVGGTPAFWEQRGWAGRDDVEIVTLNLIPYPSEHPNVHPVVGDACRLPARDQSFDVVFSNSVIEHLYSRETQEQMAREIRRVGVRYWVQTPNYWFPIEPHFLAPGWQWLPVRARVEILRRHRVGQMGRTPDREHAEQLVREVRLMRRHELADLFPGSRLIPERVGGLVKSWTAAFGF